MENESGNGSKSTLLIELERLKGLEKPLYISLCNDSNDPDICPSLNLIKEILSDDKGSWLKVNCISFSPTTFRSLSVGPRLINTQHIESISEVPGHIFAKIVEAAKAQKE